MGCKRRPEFNQEAAAENLVEAIRTILSGGVFASPTVMDHFLLPLSNPQGRSTAIFPIKRPTDRELGIFEFIGSGKGNQDIAGLLGIGCRTIDAHHSHIREIWPAS
jgi:DNA-binding NarL/FixJ family response regulator